MKKTIRTQKKTASTEKVKTIFNPKTDVIQKQTVKFEGKPLEIKTIFNPKKPDLTLKERK